jgi:predicted DNA-binding transcriptional regulator AlpA
MIAVLRTEDAAKYLGMSVSTLTKTRLRGGPDCPPFVQLSGRSVGYLVSDLDAWLARRRRASTSGTCDASAA